MKKFLLIVLMLAASAVFEFASARDVEVESAATSGTVEITRSLTENWYTGGRSDVVALKIEWTSASSGKVSVPIDLNGVIVRVVTDPGSTAPTDDYDIVITDAEGADVLVGGGANRDTTNTEQFAPLLSTYVPVAVYGTHTFNITNAGSAKVGVTKIYLRR